ncbi:MAG: hypothetical protein ACLROQ_06775, partial [Streptococcus salivarius]
RSSLDVSFSSPTTVDKEPTLDNCISNIMRLIVSLLKLLGFLSILLSTKYQSYEEVLYYL